MNSNHHTKQNHPLAWHKNHPSVLLIVAAVLIAVGYWFIRASFGANTALYLTPASGSVVQNATFAVAVRLNTGGENVNTVQANLSYPADKLDYISLSDAGSAFSIVAESQGGNGSIRIARAVNPGVTGDVLVSTISFKAKAGSGAAVVAFASGSAVARSSGDGVNILSGTTGSSYNLSTPSVAALPTTPVPAAATPKPLTSAPKPVGTIPKVTSTNTATAPSPTPSPSPTPQQAAPIAAQSGPTQPAESTSLVITPDEPATGSSMQLGAFLKPLGIGGLVLILAGLAIFGVIRLEQSGAFHHSASAQGGNSNTAPAAPVTYPANYLPDAPPVPTPASAGQPLTLPSSQGEWHTLPLGNAVMAAVVLMVVAAGVWVVRTGQAAIQTSTPTPTPICQTTTNTAYPDANCD